MNKIYTISLFIITLFTNSCTEVVTVDLDTASPKLVIEADINWQKGTLGNKQKIKLTTTTNYYTNLIPTVSNATVTLTNSANISFNFIENPGTGDYICTNFVPELNQTYTLTILHNGNVYKGTETLTAVPPITNIIQNNEGGLTGNQVQIKTFYDDPANEENFYLYRYKYTNKIKPDMYTGEDIFYDGNPFFSVSFNDELKPGDQIDVTHYGISKKYYNYIKVLLSVAGNTGGGPFQAPPVTVRGNILNTTNQDDFPFGYFNLSETDTKTYTIQ
jgi:Domain of unknown function (DUF4249)